MLIATLTLRRRHGNNGPSSPVWRLHPQRPGGVTGARIRIHLDLADHSYQSKVLAVILPDRTDPVIAFLARKLGQAGMQGNLSDIAGQELLRLMFAGWPTAARYGNHQAPCWICQCAEGDNRTHLSACPPVRPSKAS